MLALAIGSQLVALVCFIAWLQREPNEGVRPGQVYESLYSASGAAKSALYYKTIMAVKDGYVKYSIVGVKINEDSAGEDIETEHQFLRHARLIKPELTPFDK